MPDAASFTSTSPGLGGSSSISSTLHGWLRSRRMAALVFTSTPDVTCGRWLVLGGRRRIRDCSHRGAAGRSEPANRRGPAVLPSQTAETDVPSCTHDTQVPAGRRVRYEPTVGQPARCRRRRRRALDGTDAAFRQLDQSVGDDVPAPAHRSGRRLSRPDLHDHLGAAVRRASDARFVPGLARSGWGATTRRCRRAGVRGRAGTDPTRSRSVGVRRPTVDQVRPGRSSNCGPGSSARSVRRSSTSPGPTTVRAGWSPCCRRPITCSTCDPTSAARST